MNIELFPHASLSDDDLLAEVVKLAASERAATVHLIAALAEVDSRRLYLGQGCSSLFVYCTSILRLSEHAAYGRIEAARAARRFSGLLQMLGSGELTLTSLCLVAPHLTESNHVEVLARVRHLRKREVEEVVASLRPKPDVPSMIRKVPEAWRPDSASSAGPPIVTTATDAKRCSGGDESPVTAPSSTAERRCDETTFLEFHYVTPVTAGGEASVENIQLRCRAHNQYEAEVFFGEPFLARERQPALDRLGPGPSFNFVLTSSRSPTGTTDFPEGPVLDSRGSYFK